MTINADLKPVSPYHDTSRLIRLSRGII
jgi:hypothetical protein